MGYQKMINNLYCTEEEKKLYQSEEEKYRSFIQRSNKKDELYPSMKDIQKAEDQKSRFKEVMEK